MARKQLDQAWNAIKEHALNAHGTLEIHTGLCDECKTLIKAKDVAFRHWVS